MPSTHKITISPKLRGFAFKVYLTRPPRIVVDVGM